jgi:hypothetical protein
MAAPLKFWFCENPTLPLPFNTLISEAEKNGNVVVMGDLGHFDVYNRQELEAELLHSARVLQKSSRVPGAYVIRLDVSSPESNKCMIK